jgi:hypothetical protein
LKKQQQLKDINRKGKKENRMKPLKWGKIEKP